MKSIMVALMVMFLAFGAWSQEGEIRFQVDNAIELINSKLSHSRIIGINDKGIVSIKAPGQTIKFPILEVSFNYNDSDHRVRVAGDYNIEYHEDDGITEVSHRQSFTCASRRMAEDAIELFRQIKDSFAKNKGSLSHLSKLLPVEDPSLGYKTLGQAIDFINDNLALSVILDVSDDGVMVINAPSAMYRVDIKAAQYALNDWSDQARVRIYGDWCIDVSEEEGRKSEKSVPRESFSAHSNSRARQSIRALYFIKGAFLGENAAQVEEQPNLSRRFQEDYRSIEEAIDYINDRLEISIITGIDENGVMTVNASEHIYKLSLRDCRFRSGRNRISILGFSISGRRGNSVEIRCSKDLERWSDRDLQRRIDSENFSTRGRQEVDEIIEALEYIQNKVKAK